MTTQNGTMGPLARQFFAWAQIEKKQQVRTGDLVRHLLLAPQQEAFLLHQMSSRRWILKLRRGMYLVPPRLPTKSGWQPSPIFIIEQYMCSMNARFHISGRSMFNLYGFWDQMSAWFTVYNNKISKKIKINQYNIQFVRVKESRIQKTTKKNQTVSSHQLHSSPEQVLFDAIHDHSKFGTLPKAYDWLFKAVQSKKISAAKLIDVAIKQGDTSSCKRVGWAVSQCQKRVRNICHLHQRTLRSKTLVSLNPKNRKGKINKKWGVIENV